MAKWRSYRGTKQRRIRYLFITYSIFKASANEEQSNKAEEYEFSQDFNVSELNLQSCSLNKKLDSQLLRSESKKFSEIVDDFPDIESFILQDSDSWCLDFLKELSDAPAVNTLGNDSRKDRIKRWLKNEDRMMFKVIYEFIRENQLNKEILLLNLKRSEDWKHAWNLVKEKLNTNRSWRYLQLRYQKLIKNQDLNQKELSLLSVQYKNKNINTIYIKNCCSNIFKLHF